MSEVLKGLGTVKLKSIPRLVNINSSMENTLRSSYVQFVTRYKKQSVFHFFSEYNCPSGFFPGPLEAHL